MRVYAEYVEVNGLEFRTNTILQFGESWELIGNVILANPGSAVPSNKINATETEKLKLFYTNYRGDQDFN